MNLYAQGLLESPSGRALALVVGVLFGFWLERAGFGSSRKLTAIFYRRDFAVLKVMFTAIVTGAVGLYVLGKLGVVDAAALHRTETSFGPQVVGGLVFGVGFVVGGWCPGTALVGLAARKWDALAFLGGAGLGALAFAAAWPALAAFMNDGSRGVLTLPVAFGLSEGLVTAGVVALALVAFAAARRLTVRDAS